MTVKTIDVDELKSRLDNDSNLCLIDVREQDEWDEAHIPAAIHIPMDLLATNIKKYVVDNKQPIYLHCHRGGRSSNAAQQLSDLGYQEVYSVVGGLKAWSEKNYPVVQR